MINHLKVTTSQTAFTSDHTHLSCLKDFHDRRGDLWTDPVPRNQCDCLHLDRQAGRQTGGETVGLLVEDTVRQDSLC